MEELITLHHGNFAILGKWLKEYAQRTGCSNQAADWALHSQLFLDEMKKEHPWWNTFHRQEWNLFCWNECSTRLLLCDVKSIKGAPVDFP